MVDLGKYPLFLDFRTSVQLVKNTPKTWKMAEPFGGFWVNPTLGYSFRHPNNLQDANMYKGTGHNSLQAGSNGGIHWHVLRLENYMYTCTVCSPPDHSLSLKHSYINATIFNLSLIQRSTPSIISIWRSFAFWELKFWLCNNSIKLCWISHDLLPIKFD